MVCKTRALPNGGAAIVKMAPLRPKVCSACSDRRAGLLCDFPVPTNKSGTCDKPLCHRCAKTVSTRDAGVTVDFCPDHPKLQESLDI